MLVEIADQRQLDLVRHVIEELCAESEVGPDGLMVIGATCRDILHASLGHDFPLRGTRDVDVAIALRDWAPFNQLTQRLTPTGDTGIRYLVGEIAVDLMPFGDVEDPAGVVVPVRRKENMDVFALREVFESASKLDLGDDIQIRIPTAAGFCALKMAAWADRSSVGEFRDGPDIAAAIYWYTESSAMEDRLYTIDEGQLLIDAEMDVRLAAAALLGRDVASELGAESTAELGDRWTPAVRTRLVREIGQELLPNWPADLSRRTAIVEALCVGTWP